MAYFSKYNLMIPFDRASGSIVLINPLTGMVDFADKEDVARLVAVKNGLPDPEMEEYLLNRGYLFKHQAEEETLIQQKLQEFYHTVWHTPVQILLIPSYDCNLTCAYCFQHGIGEQGLITRYTVDAFFHHINRNFGHQPVKPFITLFGGEPLVSTPKHREIIEYILEKCQEHGYELSVVTNGFHLFDYLDLLSQVKVREIQVTIDGPAQVHDSRRFTAGGQGTYVRTIEGINAAVQRQIPINFRVVVDRTNLATLVELVEELDGRGWLDLPPSRFKTQVGRNYELFECYRTPHHLLTQVDLWQEITQLSEKYPVLRKFHQPEFKGIRHLALTGSLFLPSFDTCPGAKSEWVYDLHGNIYPCTASAGREDYRLGQFFPREEYNYQNLEVWQKRHILNIPQCKDCDVGLICGGGCAVIAKEKQGSILASDCRPIKELLELGVEYYRLDIQKLMEENSNE